MLILPWATETYWICLSLAFLPIPCFLSILPGLSKNRNINLLVVLSLILLISDVFFMLFIVFGAVVYNTQ